jgi:hypothetical protein
MEECWTGREEEEEGRVEKRREREKPEIEAERAATKGGNAKKNYKSGRCQERSPEFSGENNRKKNPPAL